MFGIDKLLSGIGSDGKTWLLTLLLLLLGLPVLVSSIAWPIAWYSYNTNKVAMENGYEQVRERKDESPVWIKKR